jgi:hypothetical protein
MDCRITLVSAPVASPAISTEELNAAALRELLANQPAHTGASDCPCRACFYRDDRPRYWTGGASAALVRLALLVITFSTLIHAAPVIAAERPEVDQLVKAQTDIVAAKVCRTRGFPLMARLGTSYVACLVSRAGVPNDLRVLEVDSVLGTRL